MAVRAWRPSSAPAVTGTRMLTGTDAPALLLEEGERLAAQVESVLGSDHGVTPRVDVGGRRKVLLAAAQDADLLVIDAPRRSDLSTSPLFARRLVYTAPCPVVVMPPGATRQQDAP